jgi:hypothetical protein
VNRAGGQAAPLARGVVAIVSPDLIEVAKPGADAEPATTTAHRKLLDDIIGGKADKAWFTPQVAAVLLPRLEQSMEEIKSLGAISGFELLERLEKDGFRQNRYRVRFDAANVIFTVTLDKDGKVAGLNLRPE